MDNYSIIREAILKKQQIIASYKGFNREMCPHVIGTKNGKKHCLFYQFGGESSSGPIVANSQSNWRCIFVDELTNVVARNGEWFTAGNHSVAQKCVDSVDIEVKF